jgi:hypothetical protein
MDGGTSAASPLWAGLVAAIHSAPACGGRRFGLLNPVLYGLGFSSQRSLFFNDVTTGNNDLGNLHGGRYLATPAYDMATGLGTPIAGGLLAAMCAQTPPSPTPPPIPQAPDAPSAAAAPSDGAAPSTPAPSAGPTTPPAAPVPVRAEVASSTLSATPDGVVALRLTCPSTAGDGCRVDVRVRGAGLDERMRNRRLGSGDARTLRVRLPADRLRALRRRHVRRVPLRLTVTTRVAGAPTTTSTRWVVVRIPRP